MKFPGENRVLGIILSTMRNDLVMVHPLLREKSVRM